MLQRYEGNRASDAKHVLVHYFRLCMEAGGLRWDSDNQAEIEGVIDNIVDVIVFRCKQAHEKPTGCHLSAQEQAQPPSEDDHELDSILIRLSEFEEKKPEPTTWVTRRGLESQLNQTRRDLVRHQGAFTHSLVSESDHRDWWAEQKRLLDLARRIEFEIAQMDESGAPLVGTDQPSLFGYGGAS